ncbi:FAD/NAD(P)-binding domain-containing protein [Xylariaceae sp. FL1019]|nr:FAD/NAD(P)-binding domain-containing protein [Xylariaceae sp. FL1019]
MSNPQTKTILILGGSYSGISIAHSLLKHTFPCLPNPQSYNIVLVSTSSKAMCRQATPRAMISDSYFAQEKLIVGIEDQFRSYPKGRIEFIKGTAVNLDVESRTVLIHASNTEAEEIKTTYYALVIATGSSTLSPLLGFTGDEAALHASWSAFREKLPPAKHIVVAGGGPSGVEVAGELGEHLNGRVGWLKDTPSKPKVRITLLSGGDRILPYLRPAIAQTAERYLLKLGVQIRHKERVVSVSPAGAGTTDLDSPATLTLSNGEEVTADLYIPCTGSTPNTSFAPSSLLSKDGRITTLPTGRVPGARGRIYAIGDASAAARPAVHNIMAMVPILSSNIKRDLLLAAGRTPVGVSEQDRTFEEDTRETQLVPIGKSKGVGSAVGFRLPSFLVWLIKGRDYWLWTTGNVWSGKQWNKEV